MGEYSNQGLALTGEYQQDVDSKGRVLVPNNFRIRIDAEEHGSSLYLVLGASGILCLYPERCFEDIVLQGASAIGPPDEAVAFERLSFALASRLELDSQGRLMLNERLRERAGGLKGQVTLLGVRDHIELWDTGSWEQYVSDHMAQYQRQISQARQNALQEKKDTVND